MAVDLIIFCASWCGVCRELQQEWLNSPLPFKNHWVDIEEYADHLGELEFENFPCLAIFENTEPVFLGSSLPKLNMIQKLVTSPHRMALSIADKNDLKTLLHFLNTSSNK